VVETLPAGFSYVVDTAASSTPNAAIDVEVSGQTVTFTLVAVDSLTYKVTVGSDVADGNVGLADGFGDVVETLPDGFSYVDDSAASDTPNAAIGAVVSGLTVTFTVVAVDSLTYEVRVGPDAAYFLRYFEEAER
jgi:hypothetical protein